MSRGVLLRSSDEMCVHLCGRGVRKREGHSLRTACDIPSRQPNYRSTASQTRTQARLLPLPRLPNVRVSRLRIRWTASAKTQVLLLQNRRAEWNGYSSHNARTSALQCAWGGVGGGKVPRKSLMVRCAQQNRNAQIELSPALHDPSQVASDRMTSTLVILRLRSAARFALPAQQVHWWGESCTHSDRYPRQSSSWTYIDTSTVQGTKSARDHWVISRLIATSWKKSLLSPGTAISLRPILRPGPCRRPLEICARSDGGRCECCANHQDSTLFFFADRSELYCGRLFCPAPA